ncbi:hypothetical protein Tco_0824012 [Tanacetum coccineum]|uniref:Uncharacterized protein n=1 Tax=Tanacetum coccineum TaxID=301880 RepID=A0ABQ5AKI1_9ASTR
MLHHHPLMLLGSGFQRLGTRKRFQQKELSIRVSFLLGYHHQAEEETKGKGCSLHSILSLLIMHKMKEGYGNDEITLYPTQVFSVNNWALKPNQPKEPPITDHMLAICAVDKPVEFKAPKTSSKASFIIHSESALRNDASVASTAEANPVNSAPSDFIPQQQGMNEGTINTSYDHLFAGASSVASQIKEETSNIIKLEDPVKLVSRVQPSFKDLDSPEDDHVIVLNDSDKDKDDEVHATKSVETEDTSVPKSSSPMSSQIQELTNQVLIIQSQKYKLKHKKNKAEAETTLLKAQLSFPNVEQLKELLVKSLKTEFLNILSAHDFSNSLPTELKDLPSKFNDLTKEWELPAKFLGVPSQVEMVKAKLKTIDTLPSLLKKVTNALNQFYQAITLEKTGGDNVPSASQARTQPAKGGEEHISSHNLLAFSKKSQKARKEELIDLLGPKVVNKYYNDKLQYDRYCDKMLNRRAVSRITNCDVLTRKGPITLKVYREDGTSEIIPNFKASDLHLGE